MSKITEKELTALVDTPEYKAFFSQQMSLLSPYLTEKGTCGVRILPSANSPDDKQIIFFYKVDGHTIEAVAEGQDIYEVTISAREKMQTNLNTIINLAHEEGDD